jgi:electron transfer flavoprotein beta subunit
MLAALLDVPCVTFVSAVEVTGRMVKVRREVEGETETLEVDLPCVLTAQKGLAEPRYPGLKGIMAAKKKPLEVKPVSVGAGAFTVTALELPAERQAGRIVGEGPDAVAELVRLLRDEAKVL